ncbi:MAG: hypothetical protein CSA36_01170 [Draconibacterium sp.]|nr:MAG: hypothetical protein CSA36_01170 [Draconibacterium sp.]
MKISSRIRFLVKNGLQGLLWLAIILAAYYFFEKEIIARNPEAWMEHFYSKPLIVYLAYFFSEFFFGLLPPELFMIWAAQKSDRLYYFLNVGFFAGVSYAMGYLTFLIGQTLRKRTSFRYLRKKFFSKLAMELKKYGLFLIIIAALTPLPWSAVSMLVGSSGYSTSKYLKYALFRILRFAVYGYIIFETHHI